MEAQKIKIELEVTPEMALLVSLYLTSTAKGDFTLHKWLSKSGLKYLHNIAQSIMDQISSKTDFDNLRLRNVLNSLKNPNGIMDLPDGLMDILN